MKWIKWCTYSTISICKTRDTTMEVVDLMVHCLASITGNNSTLKNYKSKDPLMLMCVDRFHSHLGLGSHALIYHTQLNNSRLQPYILTKDFRIRFLHTFNHRDSIYLVHFFFLFTLNLRVFINLLSLNVKVLISIWFLIST